MATKYLFQSRACRCGNKVVHSDRQMGPKTRKHEYAAARAEFGAFDAVRSKSGELICTVCAKKGL